LFGCGHPGFSAGIWVLVPLRGVVASQQKREIEGLGKKRRALFSSGSYRQPFDVCDKIAVENYRPAPPFVGSCKRPARIARSTDALLTPAALAVSCGERAS
jgi:hypothetical protein